MALTDSGWLGLGQVANGDQFSLAKKILNFMLDEWDGEGLHLPPLLNPITFDTASGQAGYGLGHGSLYSSIRPDAIVTAQVTISTSPTVNMTMAEMSFADYTTIPVPSTGGQPWNYAVNWTYPQAMVYLYPVPNAVYPVILNCKIKWVDTVGEPSLNPFVTASVPSGYASAIKDCLALKIADTWNLGTPELRAKAHKSRYFLTSLVHSQNSKIGNQMPIGLFPWDIGIAGRNPW
jgi:hypothetical protein